MSKKKTKICINAGNDQLVIASKKPRRRPKVIVFRNLILKYYGINNYILKKDGLDILIGRFKIAPTDGSTTLDYIDSINTIYMLFNAYDQNDIDNNNGFRFRLVSIDDSGEEFNVYIVFRSSPKKLIFDTNGERIFANDILSNIFIERIKGMIEFYKGLIVR